MVHLCCSAKTRLPSACVVLLMVEERSYRARSLSHTVSIARVGSVQWRREKRAECVAHAYCRPRPHADGEKFSRWPGRFRRAAARVAATGVPWLQHTRVRSAMARNRFSRGIFSIPPSPQRLTNCMPPSLHTRARVEVGGRGDFACGAAVRSKNCPMRTVKVLCVMNDCNMRSLPTHLHRDSFAIH